jgi:hypothetical protein
MVSVGDSAIRDDLTYGPNVLAWAGIDQATLDRNQAVARRLSEAADGELIVEYDPTAATDGDGADRGHLFLVDAEGILGGEWWLDDRQATLGQQLATRLRKFAADCERLASTIEAKA